jgi:hypothetical protein
MRMNLFGNNGDAWNYFTHDQVSSSACRRGEDGWTGLVARMIELFGRLDPVKTLEGGRRVAFARTETTD